MLFFESIIMFHALAFGEKPPNRSCRPMQPRGVDNRAHIFSNHQPDQKAIAMNATSSWAPTAHTDPMATSTPRPAARTSALLEARHKKQELAEKPQCVAMTPRTAAEASAPRVRPAAAAEPPFALGSTALHPAATEPPASRSYGAFAGSAAAPAKVLVPASAAANGATQDRIHDKVVAHRNQTGDPSQAVIGTLADVEDDDRPVQAATSRIDLLSPEALEELVREQATKGNPTPVVLGTPRGGKQPVVSGAAKLEISLPQGSREPYVIPAPAAASGEKSKEIAPKPTRIIPNPTRPPLPLSSSALQTLGNWKFQHTAKPRAAAGGSESVAASESVLPSDAGGPQIDWWVKSQRRFTEDRVAEGEAVMRGSGSERSAPANANVTSAVAPKSTVGKIASSTPLVEKPAAAAAAPAGELTLPPGATISILPDGKLKVTMPEVGPQQLLGHLAATLNNKPEVLGPKPQGNDKVTTAAATMPAPALRTALPMAVSSIFRDAGVVQSVGGPPPTSIGRKTLDSIRAERDAQAKARWLLEAPARAEALQRKVDAILKSIRTSVEAKGFSEPTKGAQFLIKTCRQHTSSGGDMMEYPEFVNVITKGLNIPNLPDDEMSALFDRLDLEEMTVVPFRTFGETVFDIYRPKEKECSIAKYKSALLNPTVRKIIEEIKTKVAQRHGGGENWLLAFSSTFRTLNRLGGDGDVGDALAAKTLTPKELQAALVHLGVPCTLHETNTLVQAVDTNKSGTVDEDEFLYAMRGQMPRKRRELVRMAFSILDTNKNNEVTLLELSERFDTSQHPRVLAGTATKEQVLQDFVALWNRDPDTLITWSEFLDYYKTLSAAIENDEYFELMMRNCWHISGGSGAAENTTCRRVLVTFSDKTQRVVEIQNDLGIGPKDIDKMRTQLERQGVRNIEKIDLYG